MKYLKVEITDCNTPEHVVGRIKERFPASVKSVEICDETYYFNNLARDVHQNAVDHGWWEDIRNDGELICLMHSELSEALEGLRHGNPQSDHIPEFTAVEEELADVIIRIMDFAAARGHNVADAISAKHEFNKTRPYKHGKKF